MLTRHLALFLQKCHRLHAAYFIQEVIITERYVEYKKFITAKSPAAANEGKRGMLYFPTQHIFMQPLKL